MAEFSLKVLSEPQGKEASLDGENVLKILHTVFVQCERKANKSVESSDKNVYSFQMSLPNILERKNPNENHWDFAFCGREGIRTPDPLGVNQVL